jgi:hypothetical protein
VTRFFDELLRRLKTRPEIAAVGASSSLPLSGQMSGTAIVAEGRPVPMGNRPTAGWEVITPGYFDAVGMRLLSGRDFTPEDRGRSPHVVIISDSLARTVLPGEDPVGRRIGVGGGEADGDWHEIIGVVAGVRHTALDRVPEPRAYDLVGQHWSRTLFVAARTRSEEPGLIPASIRATARAVDPEAPVFEAATLQELADRSAAPRRFASSLAIALAGAGLLLALVGVYAVAAAALSERTREIGVRAALGAAPRELFRLIFAEGAWTATVGGLVGVVAAALVAGTLRAHLFGARPSDVYWVIPGVFIAVVVALGLAAVPAARRAAAADPVAAMRAE